MEIRIKDTNEITKLQGGGVSPALAYYIQVPDPQPTVPYQTGITEPKQETVESNSLLDDKQAALIREHGLPSDVDVFFSMVGDFQNDFLNGGFKGSAITSSEMTKINATLNKIKYNKDQYDKALENLIANNSMEEIAVTTTGRLIAIDDEGQIKQITPTEYSKNKNKFSPLTNADIADLRANNTKYAFNTNIILSTLNNGTSMQTIEKLVQNTVNNIGKSELETSTYASKSGNKITQGLRELLSEENVDGTYKVHSKQSSQTEKAKYALNYIYSTLPENARTLLKAKAVNMGLDSDTGAYELLTMMIQSKLIDEVSTKVEYDKQASKAESSGGNSGDNKSLVSQGPLDMFINGESTDIRTYQLNPGTLYSYISPEARVFNGLPNNDNKTLAPTFLTVNKALNETALGSMGSKASVSFGNEILSDPATERTLIDSRTIAQVWLPYTRDNQGRVVPDYDTLFELQLIENEIQDAGNITEQEKIQKYKDAGLEDYYYAQKDPKYAYNKGLIRPFLAATGIASENDGYGISSNNRAVEEISDRKTRNAYIQLMYNTFKQEYKDDEFEEFTSFWGNDNIYRGTVLIPVADDRITAHTLTGNVFSAKSNFIADDMLRKARSSVAGMSGLNRTNFVNNGEN